MVEKRLQTDYKTIMDDHFPPSITMLFNYANGPKPLYFEKKTWIIDGVEKGLRYGENPGQEAALYRLVNGNLALGDVTTIQPGRWLASDVELLQSGKHPGKTNITDTDNALNMLRYFSDQPSVAIIKHNNPCGFALGDTTAATADSLLGAYLKADIADRVAAFGGTIALNRTVDKMTAEAITRNYSEVVVAPEYEEGVMEIFAKNKNLRVMKIENMKRLKEFIGATVVDFKSLIDGGLFVQTSFVPKATTLEDIKALPLGYHKTKTKGDYKIERIPTEQEFRDMWFGWLVESGVTSNSVIYVKNGVTVGIGTGEQDRVGVAEIARDKAYTKLTDRLCFERTGISYNEALLKVEKSEGKETELAHSLAEIRNEVKDKKGGLEGAIAVSDAFFPKRDGVDVVLREGIKAIIQPGGSEKDYEVIEACNENGATMIFTGQRSFKH